MRFYEIPAGLLGTPWVRESYLECPGDQLSGVRIHPYIQEFRIAESLSMHPDQVRSGNTIHNAIDPHLRTPRATMLPHPSHHLHIRDITHTISGPE
jgi:hypothetical protein